MAKQYRWDLTRIGPLRDQREFEDSRDIPNAHLAKVADVEPITIGRWISGETKEPMFVKGIAAIAKELDVPLTYFYDEITEKEHDGNHSQPVRRETSRVEATG